MNIQISRIVHVLYAASALFAVTAVALILPRPAKAPVESRVQCGHLATLSRKHPDLAPLVAVHAPECDLRDLRDAPRSRR